MANKNSKTESSEDILESPADLIEDSREDLQKESDVANEPSAEGEPEAEENEESERQLTSEEKLAELEQAAKASYDKLLRTAAELDNVRKRARRDVEDAKAFGRTEVLRDILPVIDSLDLALSTADPNGPASAIVEGVVMVRKQFLNATERYDLKPIDTVNEVFDPNFHEAVAQVYSNELEPGQIVEEVRKGYLLGDRLLRAAMVVVSKGPESPSVEAPVTEETPDTDTEDVHEVDSPSAIEGHDE